MTSHQSTATIYAFPPGGRRNLDRQHDSITSANSTPLRSATADRTPRIDTGSWYHQAAVEEAQAFCER